MEVSLCRLSTLHHRMSLRAHLKPWACMATAASSRRRSAPPREGGITGIPSCRAEQGVPLSVGQHAYAAVPIVHACKHHGGRAD